MMYKVPEKVSECYFNFLLVILLFENPKKGRIKYKIPSLQIPKTRPWKDIRYKNIPIIFESVKFKLQVCSVGVKGYNIVIENNVWGKNVVFSLLNCRIS